MWNSTRSSASAFALAWSAAGLFLSMWGGQWFSGSIAPLFRADQPPPSACWLFKAMGSSCELVKLWNVTKDAAQSQMAPVSPSNGNKVSWKEGRLTHPTMHRMIYINNSCTQIKAHTLKCHDTFSIRIHAPPVHKPVPTHRNMQTDSGRVPSVLWDISSCSLGGPLAFPNRPALENALNWQRLFLLLIV